VCLVLYIFFVFSSFEQNLKHFPFLFCYLQSIPEKFERKHENDLSKLVLLKVPSGEAWKVALAKLNGQVFFQDGREKFSDYYFIDYGDFIVFESVGTDSAEDDDSSFHLIDEVSSDSEETQLDS
jgi:hypothetical protein